MKKVIPVKRQESLFSIIEEVPLSLLCKKYKIYFIYLKIELNLW